MGSGLLIDFAAELASFSGIFAAAQGKMRPATIEGLPPIL